MNSIMTFYLWSRLKCWKTGSESCTTKNNAYRNRFVLLRSTLSLRTMSSREERKTRMWWIGTGWTKTTMRRGSVRWTMTEGVLTETVSTNIRTMSLPTTPIRARSSNTSPTASQTKSSKPGPITSKTITSRPPIAWTRENKGRLTLSSAVRTTTQLFPTITSDRLMNTPESVRQMKPESNSLKKSSKGWWMTSRTLCRGRMQPWTNWLRRVKVSRKSCSPGWPTSMLLETRVHQILCKWRLKAPTPSSTAVRKVQAFTSAAHFPSLAARMAAQLPVRQVESKVWCSMTRVLPSSTVANRKWRKTRILRSSRTIRSKKRLLKRKWPKLSNDHWRLRIS